MKFDPTDRRTWATTGLGGLSLAAWLLLTPGCGVDSPKPVPTPATAELSATPAPQVKAKGKGRVEEFDDLRQRRAKRFATARDAS
jgi:hypothetical protein